MLELSQWVLLDRKEKEKIDVKCPDVILRYNGRMGGIDKSDTLVQNTTQSQEVVYPHLRLCHRCVIVQCATHGCCNCIREITWKMVHDQ